MKRRQLKKIFKNQIKSVADIIGVDVEIVCDRKSDFMFYYERHNKEVFFRIGFNDKRYKKDYNTNVKPLGITFKENLIISTLHEIGHHKDQKFKQRGQERNEIQRKIHAILNGETKIERKDGKEYLQDRLDAILPYKIKRGQINMEMEETAWELAYDLNQQYHLVSNAAFLTIQEISLATYSAELTKAIDEYNQLKDKKEVLNMVKL